MNTLSLFLKGFACGAGAAVPGVSGGTVAVFTGVFEDLLSAVSSVRKHFLRSVSFLLPFSLGALAAIIAFSFPITYLCENFGFQSNIFFCVCSAVSLILFFRKSITLPLSLKEILTLLSGTLIAFLLSAVLSYRNIFRIDCAFPLFVCGIILALALILPAVSFSYMLLFFGIYEKTLKAVTDFDISFLLPLSLGVILGIFLFSSLLKKAVDKNRKTVYCLISGFVIYSLISLILRTFLYY